ncbi:hypothetical protein EK21DRAFT_86028 [Setomelanomma holmii]|uniref:Uncharacterized protein n=1 Tax=Setomelanomma holmii TaxID=210430 RepID=A0A9P4HJ01_9PLEO|nr:hypothetical protein EK21DRAFT_86028 [Setomelanomma holmii]
MPVKFLRRHHRTAMSSSIRQNVPSLWSRGCTRCRLALRFAAREYARSRSDAGAPPPSPPRAQSTQRRKRRSLKDGAEDGMPRNQLYERFQGIRGEDGVMK